MVFLCSSFTNGVKDPDGSISDPGASGFNDKPEAVGRRFPFRNAAHHRRSSRHTNRTAHQKLGAPYSHVPAHSTHPRPSLGFPIAATLIGIRWNTCPGRGRCGHFPALSKEEIKNKNHKRYFGGAPWRVTRRNILSCGVCSQWGRQVESCTHSCTLDVYSRINFSAAYVDSM